MVAVLWVMLGVLLPQEEVLREGAEVTPSLSASAVRSQWTGEDCLKLGDGEAFASFWKGHGGKEERPTVDFSKEMVLVVALRNRCCSGVHLRGRRIYVRETADALRLILGYQAPVSQPPVPPGHEHQDSTSIAFAVVPRRDKAVEFYLRLELATRGDEAVKSEPPKRLARIR